MKGGWVDPAGLAKGPSGGSVCRWCALEVPKGRRTFCSEWCVHEWRLRTDMGYLREQVFARDKGICAECGMDAEAEWKRIQRLRGKRRRQVLTEWRLQGRKRRNLWDADHIVPVAEGGGECDLSNIRTLCLECHRRVTAELRDRLRASPSATAIASPTSARGAPGAR